jgi:tellurite resistance protein
VCSQVSRSAAGVTTGSGRVGKASGMAVVVMVNERVASKDGGVEDR